MFPTRGLLYSIPFITRLLLLEVDFHTSLGGLLSWNHHESAEWDIQRTQNAGLWDFCTSYGIDNSFTQFYLVIVSLWEFPGFFLTHALSRERVTSSDKESIQQSAIQTGEPNNHGCKKTPTNWNAKEITHETQLKSYPEPK